MRIDKKIFNVYVNRILVGVTNAETKYEAEEKVWSKNQSLATRICFKARVVVS